MFFASVHSKGVGGLGRASVADAGVKVARFERVRGFLVSVHSKRVADQYRCKCRFQGV
jgi:hypothetical protein